MGVFKGEHFKPLPTEPVMWPAVLIVENAGSKFDGSMQRWRGLQGTNVPDSVNSIEIQEILAVYKRGVDGRRDVLAFPPSEVGRVDARNLSEVLDNSPNLDEWLKMKVDVCGNRCCSKASRDLPIRPSKFNKDEELDQDNKRSDSKGVFNDKHCPLKSWATLKQIRETGYSDCVLMEGAKSDSERRDYWAFPYKWPFQKSRKLRELDIKFQEDLQIYRHGAVGNEKLRARLENIDMQLRKEKLIWLKKMKEIRKQCEGSERDCRKLT